MPFTSRWICEAVGDFNYNTMKRKLDSYFSCEPGERYDLCKMIVLQPEITTSDHKKYLPGTLYYQKELEMIDYSISNDGRLDEVKDLKRSTYFVNFFMTSNPGLFIFNNSRDYTKEGKDIISQILFDDPGMIAPWVFNIEDIESAVLDGSLSGMWTFSFKDRQGNIQKGSATGTNVNLDSLYGLVAGAPRNFIGIERPLGNQTVKVRISRNGSINVYSSIDELADLQNMFELIEQIGNYRVRNNA